MTEHESGAGDANAPSESSSKRGPDFRARIGRSIIPPLLNDAAERVRVGMRGTEDSANSFVVELNLLHREGVEQAGRAFEALFQSVVTGNDERRSRPEFLSKTYFRCDMSLNEARRLVQADESRAMDVARDDNPARHRVIYKLWPDFEVHALIDRSVSTVKADAAHRSYEATGSGIVWAVIDSGVEAAHAHFGRSGDPANHSLLHPSVVDLHRDFTAEAGKPIDQQADGANSSALTDPFGHGTHVAGIIAGDVSDPKAAGVAVFEQVFDDAAGSSSKRRIPRSLPKRLNGVAPECRLVSLRVLGQNGTGRASDIIRALQYIRENVNGDPKLLRVHGVNLSVGYEFDAEMFACGQSPLCVEVDRLVKSGVVVVVAAGNTGYGRVTADARATKAGLSNTINDPGNASLAITVGATHRDSPHTYGISYFSSKGPTGDGRLKPDLVAPGERITSCATAGQLQRLGVEPSAAGQSAYIDDSGTSMAAPHVSGAIAAFLSIRREFILRPEDVKKIFLETATPLGRERYFEGHGLVDLMRAIQSV